MVTVVIPNYNYKRYLKKRISSILKQTYRDIEIIFLDDASNDGSVEYAKKIMDKGDIPYRIIRYKRNSGSVFKQWKRGLEMSRGDYIWFAEADDYCSVHFLEKLMVPFVNDEQVVLSYCDSAVVNGRGKSSIPDFYKTIHKELHPHKWEHDYIRDGVDEINDSLSVKNTIPNASAVILKKSALEQAGGIPQDMRLSGDWFAYIRILQLGRIAYTSETLNTNRIHKKRVTGRKDEVRLYFHESLSIMDHILKDCSLSDEIIKKYLRNLMNQALRQENDFISCGLHLIIELLPEPLVRDEYGRYLKALEYEKELKSNILLRKIKNFSISTTYRYFRYAKV